jgi:MobA/MobL family
VAHYHCSIKTGAKGAAADHAAYIAREGRFADEERYGALEAQGVGNMPSWAREDPAAFWRAADQHERENGNTYREFELALPRELERDHQIALVQRFIESELGKAHAYQWALHADRAKDGGEQPHVHVMFSDRIQDGIEREPQQYFKRANRKSPEKGGALKRSYGANKIEAAQTYRDIRARWGAVQNLALEAHGIQARVDHRSLAEQGIHEREPGVHQGPAVAGIEARGEVSQVGERQREQIAAREAKREAVLQEARQLERAHAVAERVAARARRELAPLAAEAPAEDRAELERAVEADRRAQLERTTEAAARRVERREAALEAAAPRQLPLFTRLVEQGRVLQKRLAKAFERVKEWVQERFRPLLTREEIQAGKAEFRAEYERHRAEEAARAQALEAGRERYAKQKAAELARQQELERTAKERQRSLSRERGDDRSPENSPDHSRKKDRDHGMER